MDLDHEYRYDLELDIELEDLFYDAEWLADRCFCDDPSTCNNCIRRGCREKVITRVKRMEKHIAEKWTREPHMWQGLLKVIETVNHFNFYFDKYTTLEPILYLVRMRRHILDKYYQDRLNKIVTDCNQLYGFDIYLTDYTDLDVPEHFFEMRDNTYEVPRKRCD